ncbi:hypothetical protein V8E53_011946 [Lactarius tabidus]|jgi:ubiquitin-conjugating enzyme E2 G1
MLTNSPLPASNTLLLCRQLTELTKHPVEGFSAGSYPKNILQPFQCSCPDSYLHKGLADDNNLYEWDVMIIRFALSSPFASLALFCNFALSNANV